MVRPDDLWKMHYVQISQPFAGAATQALISSVHTVDSKMCALAGSWMEESTAMSAGNIKNNREHAYCTTQTHYKLTKVNLELYLVSSKRILIDVQL